MVKSFPFLYQGEKWSNILTLKVVYLVQLKLLDLLDVGVKFRLAPLLEFLGGQLGGGHGHKGAGAHLQNMK